MIRFLVVALALLCVLVAPLLADTSALGTDLPAAVDRLAGLAPPLLDRPPPAAGERAMALAPTLTADLIGSTHRQRQTILEGWQPAAQFTGIASFGNGTSLGAALGFRLWELNDANGLWLDVAALNNNGGLSLGISTELGGVNTVTKGVLGRGGLMYSTQAGTWMPFLTVLSIGF